MDSQNLIDQIKPVLNEMLIESGWVKGPANPKTLLFSTPLLKNTIPKKGAYQWLDNEIFTFEIVHLNTLYFIIKVMPGNESIRTILTKALSKMDCLNTPKPKNSWVNYIGHKTNLTAVDFAGKSQNEIKNILQNDWSKITRIVNKVETTILKHNEKIKKALLSKSESYPHWHRWGQYPSKAPVQARPKQERIRPVRIAA